MSRKRKPDIEELQRKTDLQWVMADPRGRRFIWRLLGNEFTHTEQTSLSESAHIVYAREGERHVGIKVKAAVLEADPMAYLDMVNEAVMADAKEASDGQPDRGDGPDSDGPDDD